MEAAATKGGKEEEEDITRGTGDTSKEVEDTIKEDTREDVAVAGSRELAGEPEAEAGAEVTAEGEEEGDTDLLCLLLDFFQEIYTLLNFTNVYLFCSVTAIFIHRWYFAMLSPA